MSSENGARRRKSDQIAFAIATGHTNEEAAAAAGVSEKTVRRALKDPSFQEQVRLIRLGIWEAAAGRMTEGLTEAIRALHALLGEGTPATTRLGAVRTFLEFSPKLRESVEHEQRIAALEKKLEGLHAELEETTRST
jgi:hypothetical protein